jgi:WD40 repeat protein
MERNPAHTYLSALPFTSPKSLISTFFLKKFPGVLHINLDTREEPQPVLMAAVSGNMIAVVISDSFLKVFDFTREGAEVFHAAFDPIRKPAKYCLSISRDQKMVALGGISCDIWYLDKTRRLLLPVGQGPSTRAQITCLAFSDDEKHIVAGFTDGTLREWVIDSGMEGRTFLWPNDVDDLKREDTITAVYAQIDDCVISGTRMSNNQARFYIWSQSGDCTFSYLHPHCDEESWQTFTLSARWLISASFLRTDYGQVGNWRIHDPLTGALKFKCGAGPREHRGISGSHLDRWNMQSYNNSDAISAISPDGKLAAFGSNSLSIFIWDVHKNVQLAELVGHSNRLSRVAFVESHSGLTYRLVSTSVDGTIRLWDLDQLFKPKEDQHPMMSWSICPKADGDVWQGGHWIQNEKGECLFWLPFSCPIRHPLNTLVIGPCTELDMTNFVYGEEWTKCRGSEAEIEPSEAAR